MLSVYPVEIIPVANFSLKRVKSKSKIKREYPIGFAKPPFLIRIVNASNAAITISYNGLDDHEFIPANGVFELPSQINSQPNAHVALFPKNTVVYVKGTAGVGTIYVSGYYV